MVRERLVIDSGYLLESVLPTVEQLGLDVDIQLEWPRQLYDDAMKINVQVYDTMYIMLSQRINWGLLIGVRFQYCSFK